MEHLDLRSAAKAASTPATAPALTPREQTFHVDYVDPEGRRHSATLVSRVPTASESLRIAQNAAAMAGCPWSHLPPTSAAQIFAMATTAVQLRDIPDWVSEWAAEDSSLLFALYAACERHADAFFRGDVGSGEGGAESSRVRVSAADAAAPAGGRVA